MYLTKTLARGFTITAQIPTAVTKNNKQKCSNLRFKVANEHISVAGVSLILPSFALAPV